MVLKSFVIFHLYEADIFSLPMLIPSIDWNLDLEAPQKMSQVNPGYTQCKPYEGFKT